MKVNLSNWSKEMMLVVASLVIHFVIILYSLYQTLISYDLYPSLGLLTYSLLSLGMHVGIFLMILNNIKHSTLYFTVAFFVSLFIFSDLYFPGTLLSTWRYTSFVAISITCLSILSLLNRDKNSFNKVVSWSVRLTWLVFSMILLFALPHSYLYLAGEIILAVSSLVLLIFSLFYQSNRTKSTSL